MYANRILLILSLLWTGVVKADCTTLVQGTPRGVMCLHCLHPNAGEGVDALSDALLNSCRENIGISFVIDGSFGREYQVIEQQVTRLLEADRSVSLHLYMINGPAQRRWRDRIFDGFGNQKSPETFRRLIQFDGRYRAKYRSLVRGIVPTLTDIRAQATTEQLKKLTISVVPMLEDNLDDNSFRSLLSLTKRSLPTPYIQKWVRSPCGDCYYGNTRESPSGVASEQHRVKANFVTKQGVISNDGWGYVYFNENEKIELKNPVTHSDRQEAAVSLEDLRPMMTRAGRQKDLFLLWIAKYQQTLPGSRSTKPADRRFPIPTDSEINAISGFLSK